MRTTPNRVLALLLAPTLLSACTGPSGGGPCAGPLEPALELPDLGALTTPAIAADRSIVVVDGGVVAVSLSDGVEQWRADVDGAPVGSPVVAGTDLWVTTDRGVSLLDTETGEVRWSVTLDPAPTTIPAVTADVAVLGTGQQLIALSPTDGAEVWQLDVGADVIHPPGTDGMRVVASGLDGRIVCVEAATGALQWEDDPDTGYLIAQPHFVDGQLVLTGYEDTVYTVDPISGDHRWSHYAGNWIGALPMVNDGVVYLGAALGPASALELTTGRTMWMNPEVLDGFQADLLVVGAELTVIGRDGHLMGLRLEDGATAWDSSLDRALEGAVSAGDRVVARTDEDGLLVLTRRTRCM